MAGRIIFAFFSVKTKAMYDKLGEGLKLIEEDPVHIEAFG